MQASKLPTRVSEADWGRVAESGVGQSRGEASSMEQATTGGHLGDNRDGLTCVVRFQNSNHCDTVCQATQRNHVPLVGTPFLETSTEGAAV